MNKNMMLGLAIVLIVVGLLKPDLSSVGFPSRPVAVDVLELKEPTDAAVKAKADVVVDILKGASDHKADAKRLRDLYLDLAKLIELDGDDEVIKTTEEIRQANSLSGLMLRLDIKGKYKDLAKANEDVIIESVGKDNIPLDKELRAKSVSAFNALAWACNLGSK